jgi:alkylation response protein AidB-like acyl-CoA dehydrogenase
MALSIINRRDIDFLIFDWLKAGDLPQLAHYGEHSKDTFQATLDLSETIAERFFLPAYKKSDQNEPWLDEDGAHVIPEMAQAVREYANAGLLAAPFSSALDGMQLPHLVYTGCIGLCMAANISAAAFPMLTVANARLITTFGTPAQIEAFAAPQIAGTALGTMCLSEPQAGSSLADIFTVAEADGADAIGPRFRLRGSKMWISSGDHDITENIIHLVLAKTLGPDGKPLPGVKGISLFIVPKILPGNARNDVIVAGLNHKMGYRGIPNCLLAFGDGAHPPEGKAGAIGYLVGEIGQGLAQMFQMMNEARINVGLGAAMLGYRGYRQALRYAQERVQGRRVGKQVAIIDHADVRRMLMTQKTLSEGALAIIFYCARLLDEAHAAPDAQIEARQLLDLLTPVAKTWPSEHGLTVNDIAIQIHGGYGYTRDFDVEQLYRDNRLNPIHEGTTGIQGLDLLGRKLTRDNGASLAILRARVSSTIHQARKSRALAAHAVALEETWRRIGLYIDAIPSPPTDALSTATHFLRAFGHAVIAWLLLDIALRCVNSEDEFARGKIASCRFFFAEELPHAHTHMNAAEKNDQTALTLAVDAF